MLLKSADPHLGRDACSIFISNDINASKIDGHRPLGQSPRRQQVGRTRDARRGASRRRQQPLPPAAEDVGNKATSEAIIPVGASKVD